MKNYYVLLSIVLVTISGCATYQPQYLADQPEYIPDPDKELLYSFYLIGDVGNTDMESSAETLNSFKNALDGAPENSMAVFLGNNVFYSGRSGTDLEFGKDAKEQIKVQINAVEGFKGRTLFVPGNRDWQAGLGELKEQEKYINNKLDMDSFYPEDGCPIVNTDINDKLALIVIDAQWYISNWDKLPTINDDCKIKTRDGFFDELEGEIKQAAGKTTLIVVHHPAYSFGPHGGQYPAKSHLLPLPVLGTVKNAIRRTSGISEADLQNKYYNEFNRLLLAVAQQNKKSIIISGHENSLQYIVRNGVHQIISGSGSHLAETRNSRGGHFSYATPGYARLDVFRDGSSSVHFYSSEEERMVYEQEVFPPETYEEVDFDQQVPSLVRASIYDEERTSKSGIYRFLMGERYRKYYSTPVEAPTVYLDTLFGGLSPVRKGGGHQSKSLRLKHADGRHYTMRAMEKDAVLFMQSTFYQDQYLRDFYDDTEAQEFVLDAFTGSHPYATFVIGGLSDAARVYHLNPKLYYVPKQPVLGTFNSEFGDALYMIEEHPSEGHSDKASFGFSDEIISSINLLEEIFEDEDNIVDDSSYIRARLFDLLIGDWDRHYDQWRWIRFEENGKTVYRPMPRDRDQAFSIISDGFILGFANVLSASTRNLSKYDEKIDIEGITRSAIGMDIVLMSYSDKNVWNKQVRFLQNALTDQVIEEAFEQFPKEVLGEDTERIGQILKYRIEHLQSIADEYYSFVNKNVIIAGTHKDDFIEVTCNEDGSVTVDMYRIKDGEKRDNFIHRTFDPNVTKEMWIYGLDDQDVFNVVGESRKIKIRLIGGQNKDTFQADRAGKVIIYDHKSKDNDVSGVVRTKLHLTDDYATNIFYYKKYKHRVVQGYPFIGSNPDDGFLLKFSTSVTTKGFQRNPFSSKNQIGAGYYFATNGFEIDYAGEFATVHNWNFRLNSNITSNKYVENFFGYGNTTPNFEADESQDGSDDYDYNRVKMQYFDFRPSFVWKGHLGGEFLLGVNFQSSQVERTEGRYLETLYPEDDPIFQRQNYVGLTTSHHYRNRDKSPYPSLGFESMIEASYVNNISSTKGFGYIKPSMEVIHKLSADGKLVLASRLAGRVTIGDDFEFFQAATIGSKEGFRGLRNQRFSGKHSFFQSSDLRYKFNTMKTRLVPVHFGIYGGFDYGRIWVDDDLAEQEDYNNDRLHTSVGGGFWITGANNITLSLGLFHSEDGPRFTFGFGLDVF
jgi:hypothetical protein